MMEIQSIDVLLEKGVRIFLIDASGVLYTDEGIVPGAKEAVKRIQSVTEDIFLVTNNTSLSPDGIHRYLHNKGVAIPIANILSSGFGLSWDPEINRLIQNKKVYVYGWDSSEFYVIHAGGECVSDIKDAEVIVVLASFQDGNEEEVQKITAFLNQNPEREIICANPDRYVMGTEGLLPVCGYYAEKIESQISQKMHWIGKPHDNFSLGVKAFLEEERGLCLSEETTCFFDDNLDNVNSMSRIVSISGTIITETGLYQEKGLRAQWDSRLTKCHYSLKKFSV